MYKKIIVPIDGSYTSSLALDEAIKLGLDLGSTIDVVHIVHTLDNTAVPEIDPAAHAYHAWAEAGNSVLEFAESKIREAGLQGKMLLVDNLASREEIGPAILEIAHKQQSQLIIIGAHGLSGYKEHTLGRVAQTLINQGEFPVWLIRSTQPTPA